VTPVAFYSDGIYVSGELWSYWMASFDRPSVRDMYTFVRSGIDDNGAPFTRSLARRGPPPELGGPPRFI
jgi:hypothetical protein